MYMIPSDEQLSLQTICNFQIICLYVFQIPNFQRFTEFRQVQVTASTYNFIRTVLQIDVHMQQENPSDSLSQIVPLGIQFSKPLNIVSHTHVLDKTPWRSCSLYEH